MRTRLPVRAPGEAPLGPRTTPSVRACAGHGLPWARACLFCSACLAGPVPGLLEPGGVLGHRPVPRCAGESAGLRLPLAGRNAEGQLHYVAHGAVYRSALARSQGRGADCVEQDSEQAPVPVLRLLGPEAASALEQLKVKKRRKDAAPRPSSVEAVVAAEPLKADSTAGVAARGAGSRSPASLPPPPPGDPYQRRQPFVWHARGGGAAMAMLV
jgi:hypothetical protein